MSWWRQTFGLDGVDLLIHAGVTAALIGFVSVSRGPDEMFPVVTGLSLLVLGIRRSIALRLRERQGLGTGEMAAQRIADLEERLAELEATQARVAELEERLDFTERVLAQSALEPRQLGEGKLQ